MDQGDHGINPRFRSTEDGVRCLSSSNEARGVGGVDELLLCLCFLQAADGLSDVYPPGRTT